MVFDIISMTVDYGTVKLNRTQARKTVTGILKQHPENIKFTAHAEEEMVKDGLTTVDAWNVLNSGAARIVDEGELVNGTYRYRLETGYITVVVAFQHDGKGLVVVTVWDKRQKERKI